MSQLEYDIKNHFWMIHESFNISNGRIASIKPKYEFEYSGFESYANSNSRTRSIFACSDEKKLLDLYKYIIENVCEIITTVANDDLGKIICTMEYMRLMVTYEFVCKPGDETKKIIPNSYKTFVGSGLNAAILGRGICQSQASFCRDILENLGIPARFLPMHGRSSHADVLIGNKYVLDPTNYCGSIRSLSGGHFFKEYKLEEKYQDFSFLDQETFNKYKEKMQEKLINVLKIDKISDFLGFDRLSSDEKQFAIWFIIMRNIELLDMPINSTTISINGYNIEISNLFELFYKANNIPFTLEQFTRGRFDSEYYPVYLTKLKNEFVKIVPRHIIAVNKNEMNVIYPYSCDESLTKFNYYYDDFSKVILLLSNTTVSFKEIINSSSNEKSKN